MFVSNSFHWCGKQRNNFQILMTVATVSTRWQSSNKSMFAWNSFQGCSKQRNSNQILMTSIIILTRWQCNNELCLSQIAFSGVAKEQLSDLDDWHKNSNKVTKQQRTVFVSNSFHSKQRNSFQILMTGVTISKRWQSSNKLHLSQIAFIASKRTAFILKQIATTKKQSKCFQWFRWAFYLKQLLVLQQTN